MKATREQLAKEVVELAKREHLFRVALTHALCGLQPDVTTAVDPREWYDFYFLELELPHGGIVLVRHSVQQSDGRALVTPATYYLDDLDTELRHVAQPGQTFWNLFSGPIHKAKRMREEASHAAAC